MKKYILAAILILTATASQAEVIAKYNGIPVTREEVDKSLAQMAPMEGAEAKLSSMPADFQKNFVEKYIENKLIIAAAKKQGLQRDPEIIAKIKEAEEYLLQQKYLTDIVKKQKTDAKLHELYAKKYNGKDGEQEVMAAHILVKTEEEAKAIKAQLDKGVDFAKLAKEKSLDPGAKVSGGDLGFFTYEQMVPEFSKVAFALQPVAVSEPVKTEFGWHIIKTLARRTKEAPKFEDAKQSLESELTRTLVNQEVDKLRNTASIQFVGSMANIAAKAAPAPSAVKPTPKIINLSKPAAVTPAKPAAAAKPAATPAKPATAPAAASAVKAAPAAAKPEAKKE